MNDYRDFTELIQNFIRLFQTLIPLEQEKLEAALKNRPSFVEDCMNKEQAAILRLRGLEQKRESILQSLGMESLTFRQIIEQAPEAEAEVLRPLFEELSSQIRTFQEINASAKDAIEVNLHMIQSQMGSSSTSATYSAAAETAAPKSKPRFTNRSV